ncbi:doublecortin domain-containing protein 2 isoform X2 [Notolabrus celidotus]|uniref:doublecortin domain-containing protein 2 isoform X2 n=1 Tax=Notolabrus celidotus TaxID=1203425 RepID=UPI00148F4C6B|nr:doublecortin domain-containing protein 2 isoform X2 [Notolabrus celidotus]
MLSAERGGLPLIKTIIVFRNGDAFSPGRKVVVIPRQVTNFDNFLASLTRVIEAPFGAVRKLYTPREGHKVQRLDDLKHGHVYVAAGNEQFKTLDYCEITTKNSRRKKTQQIRPVHHSRIVVSARWRKTADESCTINVLTNGDVLAPPVRVCIPKYTLKSGENVLAMVTEKVRLRTGAVHRLCTLDGRPVCGPTELRNNHHYVAVGAEKFKALPYELCIPGRDLIREIRKTQSKDKLPDIRKTRQAKDMCAHTGFGEDLEHTARGHTKKHAAKPERTKKQGQVSRNPAPLPSGEGSVFNKRNIRSEMEGAKEVLEDSQTKVDLPIDQVEAKTVDEEDESCCASPCKASLHDSDALCLQRSLTAGSRKDHCFTTRQRESVKGTGHRTSTGNRGLKTPVPEVQLYVP